MNRFQSDKSNLEEGMGNGGFLKYRVDDKECYINYILAFQDVGQPVETSSSLVKHHSLRGGVA